MSEWFRPKVQVCSGIEWAIELGLRQMSSEPRWAVYDGTIVQGFIHDGDFFWKSVYHGNQWVCTWHDNLVCYTAIEGAIRQQEYQIREMARERGCECL